MKFTAALAAVMAQSAYAGKTLHDVYTLDSVSLNDDETEVTFKFFIIANYWMDIYLGAATKAECTDFFYIEGNDEEVANEGVFTVTDMYYENGAEGTDTTNDWTMEDSVAGLFGGQWYVPVTRAIDTTDAQDIVIPVSEKMTLGFVISDDTYVRGDGSSSNYSGSITWTVGGASYLAGSLATLAAAVVASSF